ncbi:uncharacterized protein LOC116338475 [Contarinia nasturtii]|uniref:uncharacterized protein LOC116338475 n=1 Tax=Contarinia nasturtii TaxID=265458 RepID=UPI0012D37853|nr:uncharacterized protein LOC116338475 [Contarinia nasturtii]
MDSPSSPAKCLCRVCGEDGKHDLWETKFQCNDTDVMFIDAYNCFSVLNNDASVHLCETCSESLIFAYSFWQQIKKSDEKFKIEPTMKIEHSNVMRLDNRLVEYVDDDVDELEISDQSNTSNAKNSPAKRKLRKTKTKLSESAPNVKTTTAEKKIGVNIGVNIGLPHFIIANAEFDEHELQDTLDIRHDVDEDSQDSYRKKIKTLKPSAVIPPDLDKINELCMSPMELDGDTQSIYKCSHCPKAFAGSHHLMIHMRKSHMCQYCLSTFSKINDLYSHVKEMHKTFDCLLCSKEFQSNGNLRQHMRKNHSIFLPAHISLLNISDISQ